MIHLKGKIVRQLADTEQDGSRSKVGSRWNFFRTHKTLLDKKGCTYNFDNWFVKVKLYRTRIELISEFNSDDVLADPGETNKFYNKALDEAYEIMSKFPERQTTL